MKQYAFMFEFTCEREPSYEEKMEIASKGLNALHDVVYEVIGEPAHHNMDFGFYGVRGKDRTLVFTATHRKKVKAHIVRLLELEKDGRIAILPQPPKGE